ALTEVSLVSFELAQCWNESNSAVKIWLSLSDDIVRKTGEHKRSAIEELISGILARDTSEMDFHMERDDDDKLSQRVASMSKQLSDVAGFRVEIPQEAVIALQTARIVRDQLWQWRYED
ncbi:MAG: hypothetical protein Q7R41_15535, partial [Phycisphaerales bacterium]|nr:hypothetical protein [Phycisphaerales bacterium]